MKKFSFFLMAMLVSLTSFAAALGDGYEKVTNISTLAAGDKVVLYCDDSSIGVTGVNGTKDAAVAATGWVEYLVEAATGGVKLKDTSANKYISLTTKNTFTYAAAGSVCKVNAKGVLGITLSGTDYFLYNNGGNYYRMYTDKTGNASYKPFYVYKVVQVVVDPDATLYTITATSADETMGTVTGSGEYAEGKTATLTANANPGYKFVKWSNESTENPLKVTVTENATYTATFEAIPSMTCAEAAVAPKDAIVVLNPFDVVYVVKGAGYIYIKDASGVNLIYDFNLDDQLKAGDHVEGFVGVSSPYYGLPELKSSVSFADLTVTPGTAPEPTVFAEVPAKTDANKYIVFKNVKLNSDIKFTTASATNATITVGGKNVTVRNNFKLAATLTSGSTYDIYCFVAIYNNNVQMYYASSVDVSPERTINATVNPAETGTVTGAGTYKEGKTATLEATPAQGYNFTCWTAGTDTLSTATKYSFKVTADCNLVANFEQKLDTVYFVNTYGWEKVYAYAWNTQGNFGEWPGMELTPSALFDGYAVYAVTAPEGVVENVIFNNGKGGDNSKTADLVWTPNQFFYADKWNTAEEMKQWLIGIWTVVGAKGLMGTDWDLNSVANEMKKESDTIFTLALDSVTLSVGKYEYKAAKNHSWGKTIPGGANQVLDITTAGVYDINFVLNLADSTLTANAILVKELVIIPTIELAGDMTSWGTAPVALTLADDSLTASCKVTLQVQDYGFKMILGGSWISDADTITRNTNSAIFTGANADNSTIKADIAGEYTFTWTFATNTLVVTYPELPAGPVEIVGVVKRALQLGDTTIVLTHEADGTPHIYTVAGEAIAEVSQEGIVAKDPDNAGDYLTISDIALTEDGKLVACNYVRTQFDASYIESGYKRGTLHLYVWNDIKGAASIWFESMFTANSLRGDCGYTMAVNGTVANANILVTAVHNSHRGVRMSHYSVVDGAYVEPNYASGIYDNHLFYVGAKFKGASAGSEAATFNEATHGVNFQLNASPLAESNWVMDSEGLMPTEFGVASQQDPSIVGAVAETLVSKALVGAYYVTVGDKKVMVAPYADAEGKLAGVKLLDITAGFANAAPLTTAESLDLTAPVAATGVATTAVVESNGTLTINLIADATIYTMTATIQESPSTSLEENNVQNDIIKFYQNGQIYIMINGAVYNVMGQMVK